VDPPRYDYRQVEAAFSYKLSAFSLNLPGANISALSERVLAANLISLLVFGNSLEPMELG
jgi:hypothetical protein